MSLLYAPGAHPTTMVSRDSITEMRGPESNRRMAGLQSLHGKFHLEAVVSVRLPDSSISGGDSTRETPDHVGDAS